MDQITESFSSHKLSLGILFVGVVLVLGGAFSSSLLAKPKDTFPKASLVESTTKQSLDLKVDVSGAVKKPGVYSLSLGSRVEDLIKIAGGFSENANAEYISKHLNLSQKIADGQKFYIPFVGESQIPTTPGLNKQGSKIGINTASTKDLESLSGIGPVTAQKIIEKRPYQSLDELLIRKVISKTVYDKIKDSIDLL